MGMNGGYRPIYEKKYKIPVWIWIITVIGLLWSISGGYQSGALVSDIVSYLTVADKTPNSSDLGILNFNDCLEDYTGMSGLCDIDNDKIFALSYSSSVNGAAQSSFQNDFTSSGNVAITTSVANMTHYDVRYVNMNTSGKESMSYSVSIDVTSGNMQAVVLAVDKSYQCIEKDGNKVIDAQYITELDRISAGSLRSNTVTVDSSKFYVIVFGAENATANYTLNVSFA